METAKLQAQIICPAKINLHLEIGSRYREQVRWFHHVCTLLQGVSLREANDLLKLSLSRETVTAAREVEIMLRVEPQAPCPTSQNLIYRAARAYLKKISSAEKSHGQVPLWPLKINFSLQKKIPTLAGLGGGSSNAAATLKLLNRYLPRYCGIRPLNSETMLELAAALGSDVPFFLRDFSNFSSSLGWGLGRGEQIIAVSSQLAEALQRLQSRCQLWLLKPKNIFCATAAMYKLLDRCPRQLPRHPQDIEQQFLAHGWRVFKNDFYRAIAQYYGPTSNFAANPNALPAEKDAAKNSHFYTLVTLPQYLYSLDASWVALAGSGAAFFAWFPREHSSDRILAGLAAFPQPLKIWAANYYLD